MDEFIKELDADLDYLEHEISMLFAVLPETNRQGLFNQFHKKFTFH